MPLARTVPALVSSLALGVAACGGSTADSTGTDGGHATSDAIAAGSGEPIELAGITADHNAAREAVGVPDLVWDPALATIAANWAATCTDADGDGLLDHDANRSATYPTYVGENIFAEGGAPATGKLAVDAWVAEGASYDHATNTCATGAVCGHFTQVVWRDTQKLGCALHDCPSLTYDSTIVCDYGPGGNISGQSPY